MREKVDRDMLPSSIRSWDFLDTLIGFAESHEVDPYEIIALVETESAGNKYAFRYEPDFKYTYGIESFSKHLRASESSVKAMQKSSYGLAQIMGVVFFENGGAENPIVKYRWPTSLFNVRVNLNLACKIWKRQIKSHGAPDLAYAAYNAGSVRYRDDSLNELVNQKNVDRYTRILENVKQKTRF